MQKTEEKENTIFLFSFDTDEMGYNVSPLTLLRKMMGKKNEGEEES